MADPDPKVVEYRAQRQAQWAAIVQSYRDFLKSWEAEKKADPLNPPAYGLPWTIYGAALTFLDDLLTHLPIARAREVAAQLPDGWAAQPERALYPSAALVTTAIGESRPGQLWGSIGNPGAETFDPAIWDPAIEGRLVELGLPAAVIQAKTFTPDDTFPPPIGTPSPLPSPTPAPAPAASSWKVPALVIGGAAATALIIWLLIRKK